MQLERSNWVDYAKALGITLVVFGHVETGVTGMGLSSYSERMHHYVDSFLYTFHMPLFFFLSGLFLESSLRKRSVAVLLAGKVDSLLYPYILWSLLQGGLEVIVTHGQTTPMDVLQLWHPHGQLWFLPILFACFLLTTPLLALLKMPYFLLVWLGCLAWYLQKSTGMPDEFPFEALAGNAVYFVTGVIFNRGREWFWHNARLIFLVSMFVFVVAQYLFHFEYNLVYATVHRWAAFGLALISVCFVISGCMLLAARDLKWLEYIGRHSLEIYLMHYIAATFMQILIHRYLPFDLAYVYLLVITLVSVAGPLLAAVLIERFGLGFLLMPPAMLRLERWFGKKL